MHTPGFGDVAEKLRRSTVQVVSGSHRRQGLGSGVISTPDGTVITNAHVARDQSVRVELNDGRAFAAEVASRDVRTDLAKLKINAAGLPALSWRSSSSVRPGELAIAVGNPLGFLGALSTGVVHATGPVAGMGARSWIQAAIRLAPGNSGGPWPTRKARSSGLIPRSYRTVSRSLSRAIAYWIFWSLARVRRSVLSAPRSARRATENWLAPLGSCFEQPRRERLSSRWRYVGRG